MDFIKGMDISMLKELEELGAIYYDNGVERDIFQIFKNYDINAIRLRLWNNPYDDRWNSYGEEGITLQLRLNWRKELSKLGCPLF